MGVEACDKLMEINHGSLIKADMSGGVALMGKQFGFQPSQPQGQLVMSHGE